MGEKIHVLKIHLPRDESTGYCGIDLKKELIGGKLPPVLTDRKEFDNLTPSKQCGRCRNRASARAFGQLNKGIHARKVPLYKQFGEVKKVEP